MENALRLQEQMALEKFEQMDAATKHRVLYRLDEMAKQKGYANQQVLKIEKPYIWNQMCAQVVQSI
ncbi:hypothetical protein K8R43_04140 [archaeon]|nr:hypothetical protein [archaeon]